MSSRRWPRPALWGAATVVVVVLVAGVLLYPAWSAARGDDTRWVTSSDADTLLDYDGRRLLVADSSSGALSLVDRATGESRLVDRVDHQLRAALLPDGVVANDSNRLAVSTATGAEVWGLDGGELVAVTSRAVVVAVEDADRNFALTAFSFDGAPLWTVPGLGRVGQTAMGTEPARPPGALRAVSVVPVVALGDFSSSGDRWQLVSAETGTTVTTSVAGDRAGIPVPAGSGAVLSTWADCAEVAVLATDTRVTWADGPPKTKCSPVWAWDSARVPLVVGEEDRVGLSVLDLRSGRVTDLDWTGTYKETIAEETPELRRSWGRYLTFDGTVFDTATGTAVWRSPDAWLANGGGVVASPVAGLDRMAAGAAPDDRWLRLVDPATGTPTGPEFITDSPVQTVFPLSRDEAVIFTVGEIALLTSQ